MAAARPVALTAEQTKALAVRDRSVSLSAGAGCGKTFVLTERFLSHLEPRSTWGDAAPADLAQLAAITFTERAAREMRERIRAACRARLMTADEADADRWLKLVRDVESASISTIHAFCGALLRSNAVEAGIDPRFAVLEPIQTATIQVEVISDALRELLAEEDAAVMDLVLHYGLDSVANMLFSLLNERHRIDFAAWGERTPADVTAIWKREFETKARPRIIASICDDPRIRELLELLTRHTPDNAAMRERRAVLLDVVPGWKKARDPLAAAEEILQQARVQGGGGAKAWESPELYERIKDLLELLRTQAKKLPEKLAWNERAALRSARLGLALLSVAKRVVAGYETYKKQRGVLDFDDLVAKARDLLKGDAGRDVRTRFAKSVKLLMIDEFQDTDPIQAELVSLLCGETLAEAPLFFVGDRKQSIYRFRGADPQVFHSLRRLVDDAGRLGLTRNFRSQPAILHFVNYVFRRSLADDEGYDALTADRKQITKPPCVEFLWARPTASDLDDFAEDEGAESPAFLSIADRVPTDLLRAVEARWIARRLRQMFDSALPVVREKRDGKEVARPARPGDVVVLLRALSDLAHYERAFRDEGVPYYVVGGHAFYAQQEIFDVLNLLRAIVKATDEVALLGVLRSPFFNVSDEALFWLARRFGLAKSFLERDFPEELSSIDLDRVRFAEATLSELRGLKDRLPLADLLGLALERTGYDAALAAEYLGDRKLANLHKLMDLARGFDRSGLLGIDDFMTQLSEFVAKQPKEPPAAVQAEHRDVVRVMSIHQAKGLEFPVVVVADLDRKTHAAFAPAAYDPVLGPLVRPPDAAYDEPDDPLDEKPGVVGMSLWRMQEEVEDADELTRLFYVATTRAADFLILSSGLVDRTKLTGPWMKLLAERFDLETGAIRDREADGWLRAELGDDYQSPVVRTVLFEPPAATDDDREKRASLAKSLEKLDEVRFAPTPIFVPPAAADARARRQFSISRLDGALHGPYPPGEFLESEATRTAGAWARTPNERLGELVHAVFEAVDFRKPAGLAELVRRQADKLRPLGAPPYDEGTTLELVQKFFKTKRAKQIAKSVELQTEVEFLLAWPPGRADDPHGAFLRGIIDLLYQTADGAWRLIEFKTDEVAGESLDALRDKYEMQMLLHAQAAERITGKPPAGVTLHLLRTGEEIEFEWFALAKNRAAQLVDEAIATATEEAQRAGGWKRPR